MAVLLLSRAAVVPGEWVHPIPASLERAEQYYNSLPTFIQSPKVHQKMNKSTSIVHCFIALHLYIVYST